MELILNHIFVCTILKIMLLYLLYRLYEYIKNKWCSQNDKSNCPSITNCLTWNICKKINKVSVDINEKHESVEHRRSP